MLNVLRDIMVHLSQILIFAEIIAVWEIEWCCFNGIGMTPTSSIYLSSIKFIGDPLQASNCRCLGEMPHHQYGQNIPTIPFDKLISAIINSGKGCFTNLPPKGIPDCDDGWSLQFNFVTGGCYRYEDFPNYGYFLCDDGPIIEKKCFEGFEICYELVDGEYVIHTRLISPSNPQFNCEGNCHPICDILTY